MTILDRVGLLKSCLLLYFHQQGGWPRVVSANRLPPPGWLDRLRAEIGESRLLLFQDSRQDLDNFRAVVLLF